MRQEKEALDNRLGSERKSVCNDEEVARKAFRFNYGEIVNQLVVAATVTASKPWGEEQMQGVGIWDTGATDTVIGKHFADKMGMMVTPRMDGDGNPLTANDVRYIGTTTIKMLIGSVQTPYLLVRVSDFDPSGERQESELPDFMIGMDIICHGRFTVDSTSGETVVTFEPDF